jgi:hypothetical protein
MRGTSDPLPLPPSVQIDDVKCATIFQDHSLLTIEKSSFQYHYRLKEHRIEYRSTHVLNKEGEEVCELKSKPDEKSKICVVRDEAGAVVVLICNLIGNVEFVTLKPVQGVLPFK